MHREIVWSPLAEVDLGNILEYLAKNWNQKVRKCLVTKQNTLFYREVERRIEILRLYDTRQDPKKLKFL